jgi:hypothetical protein
VATRPCSLGGGGGLSRESFEEHASDLADLEELAYRFGVPVGDGKVDEIFTRPDALKRDTGRARAAARVVVARAVFTRHRGAGVHGSP